MSKTKRSVTPYLKHLYKVGAISKSDLLRVEIKGLGPSRVVDSKEDIKRKKDQRRESKNCRSLYA